jgi:methyl-accepting chemotaxis protein
VNALTESFRISQTGKRLKLLEDSQGTFFATPGVKPVVESLPNGKTAYRIPGRLSLCDTINGNKRRYPKRVWEKNLQKDSHLMSLIERCATFGLLEHPKDGNVDLLSPISHLVIAASLNENEVVGEIRIVDTVEGRKLLALIEAGYNPTVSSRGYGTVVRATDGIDDVQDDYVCEGWDVVFRPSFLQAVLNPTRESKTESGRIRENFASVKDFSAYNHVYGLTQRLNYKTVEEAWEANPYVQWSQDPTQFKIIENAEPNVSSNTLKQSILSWTAVIQETDAPSSPAERAPAPRAVHESISGTDAAQPPSRLQESVPAAKTTRGVSVEIKDITLRLESLKTVDPSTLAPSQFAESLTALDNMHVDVAGYLAENPKASWEVQKLHTSISEVESRFSKAALAPRDEVKRLLDNQTKLLRVIKAVAQEALKYKARLGDTTKQLDEQTALTEEIARRGNGWKTRCGEAEILAKDSTDKLNEQEFQLDVSSEAVDQLAEIYNSDVTDLGRRVLEHEHADKLKEKPELAKRLAEAKKYQEVLAIREELEGKKPAATPTDPPVEGTPATPPAAEASPAAAPVKVEGLVAVETKQGDPRSINESVEIARRLSGVK